MSPEPQHQPEETNTEKHDALMELAHQTKNLLIKAESTFPFVLFPDTIAVSRTKVAITKRAFFKVSELISLQVSDILNIEIDTGPFFGSLSIYTRIYGSKPLRITFLSRKDAVAVKQIIEGHIIASQQKMSIDTLSKDELVQLLKRLGSDAPLT